VCSVPLHHLRHASSSVIAAQSMPLRTCVPSRAFIITLVNWRHRLWLLINFLNHICNGQMHRGDWVYNQRADADVSPVQVAVPEAAGPCTQGAALARLAAVADRLRAGPPAAAVDVRVPAEAPAVPRTVAVDPQLGGEAV
jgi:hypothetical protein